ncbi:MAG: STAS domain-containing protein [Vicinamibacterales bacterium]
MQITQHPGIDWLELRLAGRLDATWAEHVSDTIEGAVRAGSHQIVLNFSAVEYISSLGIGILMRHYKRLKAVNGSLLVSEPSRATLTILTAAGLAGFLIAPAVQAAAPVATAAPIVTRPGATYQVFPQSAAAPVACTAIGRPQKLGTAAFAAEDCRTIAFSSGSFGLGLGAFGEGFDDCQDRFGEFLAAGGCAITLPTNDMHALPDYVVEEGGLVPRVETLYALSGSGDFPWMVRFDTDAHGSGKVPLTQLVDVLLDVSNGPMAAFVVLAEAAGLVGATLRRSPGASAASLVLPGVRDWLSFTTERNSDRSLALLVGVASRGEPPAAGEFLRPLTADGSLHAHVHAALFPYRPVQRGELPFGRTVADVLNSAAPSALMHLMTDTRPFEGVGESDLVRGACWVGALQTITTQ